MDQSTMSPISLTLRVYDIASSYATFPHTLVYGEIDSCEEWICVTYECSQLNG